MIVNVSAFTLSSQLLDKVALTLHKMKRDMINLVIRKKKLDIVIINIYLALCANIMYGLCKKFVLHKHVMLLPATKTTKKIILETILHIQSFIGAQNFLALPGALILIALLPCY